MSKSDTPITEPSKRNEDFVFNEPVGIVALKLDQLERKLTAMREERDNWKTISEDMQEEEDAARKAAGDADHSDTYGVESLSTIITRIKEERDKAVDEAYERVAQVCEGKHKEKGRRAGMEDGKFWTEFYGLAKAIRAMKGRG